MDNISGYLSLNQIHDSVDVILKWTEIAHFKSL